jgi:hypothetical protein
MQCINQKAVSKPKIDEIRIKFELSISDDSGVEPMRYSDFTETSMTIAAEKFLPSVEEWDDSDHLDGWKMTRY